LLARALSPDGTITDATRAEALRALIELKRIEQLKAIASGDGNSTYFFGDRAAMKGDVWHPDGEKRVRAAFPGVDGGAA
jgi:hypothetical protein